MHFYKFFFWLFRICYVLFPVGFVLLLGWIISGLVPTSDLNSVYFACVCLVILTPVCKLMAEDIGRKKKLLRLKGES